MTPDCCPFARPPLPPAGLPRGFCFCCSLLGGLLSTCCCGTSVGWGSLCFLTLVTSVHCSPGCPASPERILSIVRASSKLHSRNKLKISSDTCQLVTVFIFSIFFAVASVMFSTLVSLGLARCCCVPPLLFFFCVFLFDISLFFVFLCVCVFLQLN